MWRNLILVAWAVGDGCFLRSFGLATVAIFGVLMIVVMLAVLGVSPSPRLFNDL